MQLLSKRQSFSFPPHFKHSRRREQYLSTTEKLLSTVHCTSGYL